MTHTVLHKFGAESLDHADRFAAAVGVIRAAAVDANVVAVTTLPRTTRTLLQETIDAAADGRPWIDRLTEFESAIRAILGAHHRMPQALERVIEAASILDDFGHRTRDRIWAIASRAFADRVAAELARHDVAAVLADPSLFLETDDHFGAATPWSHVAPHTTAVALRNAFANARVAVIPGGLGRAPDGAPIRIAPGGPDLTAAIAAIAADVRVIHAWTDVDGVFSADPAIHADARRIEALHIRELAELAYWGADLFHARALVPLAGTDVSLRIRGIDHPDAAGTRVDGTVADASSPVRAVSAIRGIAILSVEGNGMAGVPGVAARTFEALSAARVNVRAISQSSSESSISIAIDEAAADLAELALKREFRLDLSHGDIEEIGVRRDAALIAAVGIGMARTPGVAANIMSALGDAAVNIVGIAQGSSELNITIAVDAADADSAVGAIHRATVLDLPTHRVTVTRSAVETVRVFAPGTIANLGPGFDILGLAVRGTGDTVVARRSDTPGVRITAIHGTSAALSLDPERNTAGIAALATLRRAGTDLGVELELHKAMPIGSGLGSSAASAAAAAFAINALLGTPLRRTDLILPCVEAEEAVSGRHADNVAPALLGGLVMVRSVDPLDVIRLPVPPDLHFAVVTPEFELPTRRAREVLPRQVPLAAMIENSANLATWIAACYSGDLSLVARCIADPVVTPARIDLIPGGPAVMRAAMDAGALGSSISGAGPSIFAICHSERRATRVGDAMKHAFLEAGLRAHAIVTPADCPGARRV